MSIYNSRSTHLRCGYTPPPSSLRRLAATDDGRGSCRRRACPHLSAVRPHTSPSLAQRAACACALARGDRAGRGLLYRDAAAVPFFCSRLPATNPPPAGPPRRPPVEPPRRDTRPKLRRRTQRGSPRGQHRRRGQLSWPIGCSPAGEVAPGGREPTRLPPFWTWDAPRREGLRRAARPVLRPAHRSSQNPHRATPRRRDVTCHHTPLPRWPSPTRGAAPPPADTAT